MDKELEVMVKSMKMLNIRSLNEHQIKTLKEIEGQFSGQSGEELASHEKKFRNMLSDVKLRSENMRRQRLHQRPT
jgi:hypothetical protein